MTSLSTLSPETIQDWDRQSLTALALLRERARSAERQIDERRDFWRYQGDPVGYARDVLGVRLTADQIAVAESVRDNRYTLAKASHSVGKTFLASVLGCWFYDCWPEHIVYVTAPTWPQALGLTFKQIKRFRLERRLPGQILDSGLVRDADRMFATSHFIRALNAEKGEGFQGEHSAPILIIIEEGPGVPPYIWDAMSGLMTAAGCRCLTIGNPTDEATPFGVAAQNPLWNVFTISGLQHPNIEAELAGAQPPFPAAVNLMWVRERLEEHCEIVTEPDGDCFEFYDLATLQAALYGEPVPADAPRVWWKPNAFFQGRVLGIFPTQADENVIPRGWLENLPRLEPEGFPEIGCDIARFGRDRTVIAVRWGPCLMSVQEIRRMDTEAVKGALKATAAEWARRASEKLGGEVKPQKLVMRIDVTGGLGAGPFDGLVAEGYAAVAVNASDRAFDKEQYLNRRSEMWFETRFRAYRREMDLSHLPREMRQKVIRELSTPKYKPDGAGHKVVERKEETTKRLDMSPDVADGVNLAYTAAANWWGDQATMERLKARMLGGAVG